MTRGKIFALGFLFACSLVVTMAAVTRINLTTQVQGILPFANGGLGTASNFAAHNWFGNNTGSTAAPGVQQPACADLSNAAASCSTNALNATNISSGTLAVGEGGTGNATGQSTNVFLQTQLGSNVTLGTSTYTPSAGTFPTVTTATAGTWVVSASIALQTTSATAAANFTCELYDGTNVLATGYILGPVVGSAAVKNWQMALTAIKTEAGTVTFTARCTSTTASQLMETSAANNGAANTATTINAFRIQ